MSENPIDFSVVIPTYNRPDQLRVCLTTLSEQQYPKHSFEVIVVNDGGVVLDDVIKHFQNELAITLVYQENAGPALARNKGAVIAKGNFIAFTDDDCRCPQDWLQQLATYYLKKNAANDTVMVGGHTINILSGNLCSVASQMIVDLAYEYFNPDPKKASFFTSSNMVFPRELFLRLGGFHPEFRTSEDREICDRWLRHGYRMEYVSSIKIYHAHRLSLFSFWRQQLSYGRGAFRYHIIRTQRGAPPFSQDFSFQRKLVTHPFNKLPLHQAVVVVGLMGFSQFAGIVGYRQEKMRCAQLEGDYQKIQTSEALLPISPLEQDI